MTGTRVIRICRYPECGTILRRTNPDPWCSLHLPGDWVTDAMPKMKDRDKTPYTQDILIGFICEWANRNGRIPTKTDRMGLPSYRTYVKHFGSWSGAVEKAGYSPTSRQGGGIRDSVLAAIDNGNKTMAEIHWATNLTKTQIKDALYAEKKKGHLVCQKNGHQFFWSRT